MLSYYLSTDIYNTWKDSGIEFYFPLPDFKKNFSQK